MKNSFAIQAENLSKVYKLYHAPIDRMKEALHPFKKKYHTLYHALENVSFTIKKGECVGVIGRNGAGKSTLLKIITGVLTPSSGTVEVNGRISALLELGAGFNPEYTGLENIFFQGNLVGFSRAEMEAKLSAIVEFADIGEFIFQPVKIYSSGMFARLAFAVSIHVKPDILIVDEALAVGDTAFAQKCVKKMDEFRNNGGTVLFVSHDMASVKLTCSRAMLLQKGELVALGEVEEVVNRYYYEISKGSEINAKNEIKISGSKIEHGNGKAEILGCYLESRDGHLNTAFCGEAVEIFVKFRAKETIKNINVGIMIRDKYAQDIFGTNTLLNEIALDVEKDKTYLVSYATVINIGRGKYTISPALVIGLSHLDDCLHWIDNLTEIEILPNKDSHFAGICYLQTKVSWQEL